jgi:mannobiose 2-epimerase
MRAAGELIDHLELGVLPFWRDRALDTDHGGFFTAFDGHGQLIDGRHHKYLNTQARLVWAFSELSQVADDRDHYLHLADQGVEFLVAHFRDTTHGGWFWKTARDGTVVDDAKLTYGHTFALYALACHARHRSDDRSTELAVATFDDLQRRCADPVQGGYSENFDRTWNETFGRKSLDIHMHVLEALAELVRLTGDAEHATALRAIRELIVTHMIDPVTGAGGNQFTPDWDPVLPVVVPRTWIDERPASEHPPPPTQLSTCYGHNLELGWLLADADTTLGEPGASDHAILALATHALTFGLDTELGGMFRDGPYDGPATDTDKEFWQNAESLPGWLEAFRISGDQRFLDAFHATWRFAQAHLVHPDLGEWRVRARRDGTLVDDTLGNDWKVCYHSGRSAIEAANRLAALRPDPKDTI